MPGDVGYVRVTNYGGDDVAYSKEIQNEIKIQDSEYIIGWIVDLRGNLGGNMWPMLAGIGPILGEGVAGYFIDADGEAFSWGFKNGASTNEGSVVTKVTDSYQLLTPNPKVAVLLDAGVASSGEAIAISFIGRANTRTFGSPTCGLSTANATYDLSYKHRLALTVAYFADRNKNKFGIPVPPDQVASGETIIQDAINWIRQ